MQFKDKIAGKWDYYCTVLCDCLVSESFANTLWTGEIEEGDQWDKIGVMTTKDS